MIFYKPTKYVPTRRMRHITDSRIYASIENEPYAGRTNFGTNLYDSFQNMTTKNTSIPGSKGERGQPELPPLKAFAIMKKNLPMPQPPPKFIRDSINIDDIDGARSRRLFRGRTRLG